MLGRTILGNYQILSFILIINSNSLSKTFEIKGSTNSIQARNEKLNFLNSNIASIEFSDD